MKFENMISTEVGESSEVQESNGKSIPNNKNGILKESTNGVSSGFGNGAVRNGSHQSDRFFGHSRQEVTRLMIQTLNDLGYTHASKTLSDESGFNTESNDVSEFRAAVLAGQWSKAESHLSNIPLLENASAEEALFLIREQKFLEALEDKEYTAALSILRTELSPLNINTEKVHNLSSLVMISTTEDLKIRTGWDGKSGKSRSHVLMSIEEIISPVAMVPARRLVTLLQQAKDFQIHKCLFHLRSSDGPHSLLTDHTCDSTAFPSATIRILTGHKDEVWDIKFSHDGTRLASSSKDSCVIIWDTETWEQLHVLRDHTGGVASLDWSPDDERLLTASHDHKVKMWTTDNGVCIRTMEHNDIVTVCRWFPNGQNFISASVDKEVIVWNLLGTVVHQWSLDRMFDLAITPDGSKMVAICNERKLHIYNINDDFREHLSYQMPHNMTSIVASNDSKYVLINSMAQEVHLWDIERFQLVRKFVGQTQEKFMIRSCFGGPDQNFVLSGSEDSRIYVWNREHGTLIDTIEGHTASCNCVAWNPVEAYMFASAGDDHEIRMYAPFTAPLRLDGRIQLFPQPPSVIENAS